MGGKQSHLISAKYNLPSSSSRAGGAGTGTADDGAADRTKRRRGGGGSQPRSRTSAHRNASHATAAALIPLALQHHHRRSVSGTSSDGGETNTTSTTTNSSNDKQQWIHEGMDVEDVYDVHETIAYGLLGPIRICSRRRRQHSNHTGDLITVVRHNNTHGVITKSDRTSKSTGDDSSSLASTPVSNSRESYHRLYACKYISTSRLTLQRNTSSSSSSSSSSYSSVQQVLQRLQQIRALPSHPNIGTIKEVYATKRHLHVITNLCTGGDLFTRMNDVNFTELDVIDVLEQVVDALVVMHARGIVHMSIEMENILYEHGGSNAGVQLMDFGLSARYEKCCECRKVVGATYAAAPETIPLKNPTTTTASTTGTHLPCSPVSEPAGDIWSVGVVAYCMLSGGSYPFGTDREMDLERLLKKDDDDDDDPYVTFDQAEWAGRGISELAKTFCIRCLNKDPTRRWTASDALAYIQGEWVGTVESTMYSTSSEQPLSSSSETPLPPPPPPPSSSALDVSLRGVQDFGLYGQRRKRLLCCLANTMDKRGLDGLKEMFLTYDQDQGGTLTLQQVKKAVKQYCKEKGNESELTKEDVKEMLKGCHQDRCRSIEYEPFLEAVLQMQGMMTQEQLGDAFDRADPEGKGLLSKEEIMRIIGPDGADRNIVEQVFKEANCEKPNGMVEYDVFLNHLFHDPGAAMEHLSRHVGDPL